MKRLESNLTMYQSDTRNTKSYKMKNLENG